MQEDLCDALFGGNKVGVFYEFAALLTGAKVFFYLFPLVFIQDIGQVFTQCIGFGAYSVHVVRSFYFYRQSDFLFSFKPNRSFLITCLLSVLLKWIPCLSAHS